MQRLQNAVKVANIKHSIFISTSNNCGKLSALKYTINKICWKKVKAVGKNSNSATKWGEWTLRDISWRQEQVWLLCWTSVSPDLGSVPWFQWKKLSLLQDTSPFWKIPKLCGNGSIMIVNLCKTRFIQTQISRFWFWRTWLNQTES